MMNDKRKHRQRRATCPGEREKDVPLRAPVIITVPDWNIVEAISRIRYYVLTKIQRVTDKIGLAITSSVERQAAI